MTQSRIGKIKMTHGSKRKRFSRGKGASPKELVRLEKNRSRVIKSLYSRSGLVKMADLVADTKMPRQTILRHLKALETEGRVKRHGKIGWQVVERLGVYIRNKPNEWIRPLIEKANYESYGNLDMNYVTLVEFPRGFLSPNQIHEIQQIVQDGIEERLKTMPDKAMLAVLINKKPSGKLGIPVTLMFAGRKPTKEYLERIRKNQKASKPIQKLIKYLKSRKII